MIDFNNRFLAEIEKYLSAAVERSEMLDDRDVDPRDVIYQLSEHVEKNSYILGEASLYVPNIITISIPENKTEKVEDIETIFSSGRFLELLSSFLADESIRLLNPLRVEVMTVSKGNSRVMYGRAGLSLDWPGPEMASEDALVELDFRAKRIVSIHPPHPQIPQLSRITAVNAEVYQNPYLITKPNIHIGRLRSVFDEANGRFICRNDFVFSHQEIPDAVSNSVSRRHASILFRDGAFYLFDHGSSNGTKIQRKRSGITLSVTANDANGVRIEDGDTLRFGSALVGFELVPLESAE